MPGELSPKMIDRIVGFGRYMVERSPVIWDEIPCVQPVKQCQRITTREMAPSKSRLPPWRVTDRQQGDVQPSIGESQVLFNQIRTIWRKRSIPGKETRQIFSLK